MVSSLANAPPKKEPPIPADLAAQRRATAGWGLLAQTAGTQAMDVTSGDSIGSSAPCDEWLAPRPRADTSWPPAVEEERDV